MPLIGNWQGWGVEVLAMFKRSQKGEGCPPPESRGKKHLGNAKMRDVPETRGGNKDSKDQMKVKGGRYSKSKGGMLQQWKDCEVSARLE